MKTIYSTINHYEGRNKVEDGWEIGSYSDLYNNVKIDNESIEHSEAEASEENSYFMKYLDAAVKAYEKRYRTTVTELAFAGRMSLWNGSPVGGRFIPVDSNPICYMGNVEDVEIVVEADGTLTFIGYHHDGRHRMQLYLLTDHKMRQVAPERLLSGEEHFTQMQKIYENLKPLRYDKLAENFYGQLENVTA